MTSTRLSLGQRLPNPLTTIEIEMIAPLRIPLSDDPDAKLMALVRDGKVELFNELVRRHEAKVTGLIRHMQGNDVDSEDLSQQVFMKAFRARHTYTPSAMFTTWLFTITRNVVLNARRQNSRRREICVGSSYGIEGKRPIRRKVAAQFDPTDEAIRQETQQALQQAINQLGARQQQAIRLVCLKGYRYRAAAEQLDMTEKAIKSLVHRAKNNLRILLESRSSI